MSIEKTFIIEYNICESQSIRGILLILGFVNALFLGTLPFVCSMLLC